MSGLDKAQLERKIRLLTLASLGFQNIGKDIPYATLASALQIDQLEGASNSTQTLKNKDIPEGRSVLFPSAMRCEVAINDEHAEIVCKRLCKDVSLRCPSSTSPRDGFEGSDKRYLWGRKNGQIIDRSRRECPAE